MAKREFIETREIVYVNAPIAPILQGDSIHYEDIAFKSQIGRIHSFSEQDIVKPYLEKLKDYLEKLKDYLEKLKEQVSHCNLCLLVNKEDVLGFIDNLLSEQEVK
mgnify:CR=1 FL=1